MRQTGNITNIVLVGNTITIHSDSLSELVLVNQIVELAGITGLDKNKIISIDYDLKTFDILKPTGFIINETVGTWIQKAPFEYFSEPLEFASKITHENKKKIKNIEKFPSIYLVDSIEEEKVNEKEFKVNNAEIFIMNKTILDEKSPNRYLNEYPYLSKLRDEFEYQLKRHYNLISDFDISYNPISFADTSPNETVIWIKLSLTITYNRNNIDNC